MSQQLWNPIPCWMKRTFTGVAEKLKHSKEFGALVWDSTADYVQKMNLTSEEKANVSAWLLSKKDRLQKTIVEKLHSLHQGDD